MLFKIENTLNELHGAEPLLKISQSRSINTSTKLSRLSHPEETFANKKNGSRFIIFHSSQEVQHFGSLLINLWLDPYSVVPTFITQTHWMLQVLFNASWWMLGGMEHVPHTCHYYIHVCVSLGKFQLHDVRKDRPWCYSMVRTLAKYWDDKLSRHKHASQLHAMFPLHSLT